MTGIMTNWLLTLVAALAVSTCILGATTFWLHNRLLQTRRLAELSEQGRASRVRAEVARQLTKRHENFVNRYVSHLAQPAADVAELSSQLEQEQDTSSAEELTKELNHRAQHLAESVTLLKDYASLERGQLPLKWESVEGRALLEEAIANMRNIFHRRSQRLILEIGGWQNKTLTIDREKFISILAHLAHSASVNQPLDTTFTLTAENMLTGNGRIAAWLRLSDKEPGIESYDPELLFDPLAAPVHQPTAKENAANAIDLPFARQLAELMGGRLNFRSGPDGSAAELELFLDSER